jgi:uncharacterized membrane protein
MSVGILSWGVLLLGGVSILAIIVVVVLLAIRRKPAVSIQSSPVVEGHEELRGQRRETILEALANKEITQEEAERKLLDLDTPLPEQMPAPLPTGKGCGKGCLVAAICGVVAFVVLILFMFLMLFSVRPQRMHDMQSIRIEEMNS